MCSAGNLGSTWFSRRAVHIALLSKVGGDETMVGLRAGKVRAGESAEETIQPSVIKHHKPEQKEPLEVVFELVELNSAFEKAVLHI